MHDISYIHEPQPDPPADRRGDMRIDNLQLGVVDRALVGFDCAFELPDLRLLRVYLLFGYHALFVEKLISLVIDLHVPQLRLILRQLTSACSN